MLCSCLFRFFSFFCARLAEVRCWIALSGPFFHSFPFYYSLSESGKKIFVWTLFEKVKRLVAKRFAPTELLCICWVGSWARARIHSLFDYSTFSILSQSRHKVFLHEQEHSPLIRHWGCQGTSTRKDAFSTEDAPTIRNTHTPKIAPGGLVSVYFWT